MSCLATSAPPPGELLLGLGSELETCGHYTGAARCYSALSSSSESSTLRARGSVQLARLLLRAFDNVDEAVSALVPMTLCLKDSFSEEAQQCLCGVYSTLADCYAVQRHPAMEEAALKSGLQVANSQIAVHSQESENPFQRWSVYFCLRLGRLSAGNGSQAQAEQYLDEALKGAGLAPSEQRALKLANAALQLIQRQHLCGVAVEELSIQEWSPSANVVWHFLRMARLFLDGNHSELRSFDCFTNCASALEACNASDSTWEYQTPSPNALFYLLRSWQAHVMLCSGKPAVADGLLELPDAVPGPEGWAKQLILQQRVLNALIQCDFESAANCLHEILSDVQEPSSTTLLLAGMYAGATDHSEAAQQLLKRARQDGSSSSQLAAVALDIVSDDCTLSEYSAHTKLSQADGSIMDRAAAHLAKGKRLLASGDTVGAKLRWSQALRLSHRDAGNTQLTVQVLNSLAPLLASGGDQQGAESMLASATTLSRLLGDLISLLSTLEIAQELHESTTGLQGNLTVSQGCSDQHLNGNDYVQRKREELAERVRRAKESSVHDQVFKLLNVL